MMAMPNTAPTMCTFELMETEPRPSGQALEVQSRCDGKVTRFYDGVPGRTPPYCGFAGVCAGAPEPAGGFVASAAGFFAAGFFFTGGFFAGSVSSTKTFFG